MNKELIELQRGCKATCVVIQDEELEALDSKIVIESNCSNNELRKIFKEQISNINKSNYIIIKGIDTLSVNKQNKYYQIVKDREFFGYKLPKDIIIILTIKDINGLKNILQELFHLCVVAI